MGFLVKTPPMIGWLLVWNRKSNSRASGKGRGGWGFIA